MVFGVENFDQIADNQEFKNILIGFLVKIKQEAEDDKTTWLETYRDIGETFMKARNINTTTK